MNRPRVLLVLDELGRTGAPLMALRTFASLREAYELTIVANRGGPLEADLRRIGRLTVLQGGPLTRLAVGRLDDEAAATFAGTQARLASRIVQLPGLSRRPDLVYLNSAASLAVVRRMPWVARLSVPVILHVHETGVLLSTFASLTGEAISTVPDRYIAVSDDVASSLTRHAVPGDRIRVIPPFVDQRWIERGASVAGQGHRHGQDRPFVVGGVGRPSWTKGPETWLQTARELTSRDGSERFRFEWLGVPEGLVGRQFDAMVAKLGLVGRVESLPEVPDPMEVMASWDALLVASWEESASLAALEAMALGKVVACYRGAGGTAELVADAGVVVDGFAPARMADAIARMADDPVSAATLGAAAHRRVAEGYTLEVSVLRIRSVIDELLAEDGAGAD